MCGRKSVCLLGWLALLASGCDHRAPLDSGDLWPLTRLHTDRTYIRDEYGRYVFFHGVNVSGSTKLPGAIDGNPFGTKDLGRTGVTGIPSYLGRPFSPDEIEEEVDRLHKAGFTAVRLLVNWEGIEPERKGRYDRQYLQHLRQVVQAFGRRGMYVVLDMHQDAFSRHLVALYDDDPSCVDSRGNTVHPPPGSIENMLFALLPPYDDGIRDDGAPRWAVEACLPEKDQDAPSNGITKDCHRARCRGACQGVRTHRAASAKARGNAARTARLDRILLEPSRRALTAVAGMKVTGALEGAKGYLQALLGPETGVSVYDALVTLRLLPQLPEPPKPDASAEERKAYEDEVRDWYDNLDERLSTYGGGFFLNRAGLLVADGKVEWRGLAFFWPSLSAGVALPLNPHNALGGRLVGVELDADLEFRFKDAIELHVVPGVVLPGRAASVLNRIDKTRTDPIGYVEVALTMWY